MRIEYKWRFRDEPEEGPGDQKQEKPIGERREPATEKERKPLPVLYPASPWGGLFGLVAANNVSLCEGGCHVIITEIITGREVAVPVASLPALCQVINALLEEDMQEQAAERRLASIFGDGEPE